MWLEKLKEINEVKKAMKLRINSVASDNQIANIFNELNNKFNFLLPDTFMEFLKKENGFEFNGFIIYGVGSTEKNITDFISTNEIWHEDSDSKNYIFFGDSNISWYCFDTEKGEFVELDKPSGSLIEEFENFDDMLDKILSDCLL